MINPTKYRSLQKSALCLLGLLIVVFTACNSEKTNGKKPLNRFPVNTATARSADIPYEIRAIGNVEAYNAVSVKALVGGEIVKVYFKEGQHIDKNNMLLKIDPRPFEAALRQAEANLARDRALARKANEDVERYSTLVKNGYVARQDYDQVLATGESLNATVKADIAAVEANRLQLDYTDIRSPIDGLVGNTSVNVGNVVKANDATLVSINQIHPVYVAFTVPEGHLAEIKKYMTSGALRVTVTIPEDGQGVETGVLTSIDNAVDKATGTIRLKATFKNMSKRLWPGQFVNVALNVYQQKNALIVPSQAVQLGQSGPFVFVVKKDLTVELRSVTIARTYLDNTLIDQGLQPGEHGCHGWPAPVDKRSPRNDQKWSRRRIRRAQRRFEGFQPQASRKVSISDLFITPPRHDDTRHDRHCVVRTRRLSPPAGQRNLPNVDFPTIKRNRQSSGGESGKPWRRPSATPLERQFSTIAGLDSMTSTNALGATPDHPRFQSEPRHRRSSTGCSGL